MHESQFEKIMINWAHKDEDKRKKNETKDTHIIEH
jgi:hypothetical protein